MNVLGLNFGHDAGVSLVRDGKFIHHWEKERHTRVRHAIGLRLKDILQALDYFGIRLNDIDAVATCSTQLIPVMLYDNMKLEFHSHSHMYLDNIININPEFYAKTQNNLRSVYNKYLDTLDSAPDEEILFAETGFPNATDVCFFELASQEKIPEIPTRLHTISHTLVIDGRRIPGVHVSHHLCHAYYAYSQLGQDSAAILTFDGGQPSQSFKSGGLYFGNQGMVAPIHYHKFFFGSFYDSVGFRLNLGLDGAPGSLMGLAAWGSPIYYEPKLVDSPGAAIRFLLGEEGETRYSGRAMVQSWMSKRSIPARQFDLRGSDAPPRLAADIAASAQAMFTDTVLKFVEAAARIAEVARFDFDTFVFSGGCALNCPANSAVFRRSGKRVFVPPAVNDEGNSAGAALCCASLNGDSIVFESIPNPAEVAYKGIHYHVPQRFDDHRDFRRVEVEDAAGFLARKIADGAVAGIFDGKAEIGPRALGHRSLIASPLTAENWKRINLIKQREPWRPLAPVVLDQDFHRYFAGCPEDSFYMLFNANVKTDSLPAVTHCDRTARVQVAVKECGFIYELLLAFRALTGIGVLLNTSFNGRGEPIIETPADALRGFAAMNFEYLYLQGIVLCKR